LSETAKAAEEFEHETVAELLVVLPTEMLGVDTLELASELPAEEDDA